MDVATLGAMATNTGGTLRRYPLFKSTHDGEKVGEKKMEERERERESEQARERENEREIYGGRK